MSFASLGFALAFFLLATGVYLIVSSFLSRRPGQPEN